MFYSYILFSLTPLLLNSYGHCRPSSFSVASPNPQYELTHNPIGPLQFRMEVYSNCEMVLPIALGNPMRQFNLQLQFITSVSMFLTMPIPYKQSSRADPPFYERQIYEPSSSHTFKNLSKAYHDPVFDKFDGSGYMAEDMLNLLPSGGHSLIPPIEFGIVLMTNVTDLFEYFMELVPADGILGLAHEPRPGGMSSFSFFSTLAPLLDVPALTFYLKDFNARDPDELKKHSWAIMKLGGSAGDLDLCSSNWMQTQPSTGIMGGSSFWTMNLNSVSVDGHMNQVIALNQEAIMYPNYFFTTIPMEQMNFLAELLNATSIESVVYLVPCNSTATAPSITFEFNGADGHQTYVVFNPADYILPSDQGGCQLIFNGGFLQGTWFLGYSFFKHHCFRLIFNPPMNSFHVELAQKIQ